MTSEGMEAIHMYSIKAGDLLLVDKYIYAFGSYPLHAKVIGGDLADMSSFPIRI
jgi:hypothetical protein